MQAHTRYEHENAEKISIWHAKFQRIIKRSHIKCVFSFGCASRRSEQREKEREGKRQRGERERGSKRD